VTVRGPAPTATAPQGEPTPPAADALGAHIAALQEHLSTDPNDADAWATLGLDYVQEAKNTANPQYYPKADGALATSLRLQPTANAPGLAGTAALRAAQHRFAEARDLARQALAVEPYNSTIYGILADALTQLGRYDEARAAVQHMLDLRPGTPAFTRAEYVYELSGQVDGARDLMNQALEAATAPADGAELAAAITLTVDGGALPLQVVRAAYVQVPGAAALPVGRLECRLTAPADLSRPATVELADPFDSAGIGGWHEITAVGDGVTLQGSPVPAASISDTLRTYPNDLLSSPLDVRTTRIVTAPGAGASTYGPVAAVPGADVVLRALNEVSKRFNARRHA
jgi:hypothetical protein